MTPIFSRSWLMKMRHVFDFDTAPVSLRSACDMSRACSPICASPISPSISAFGTSAATESTTTTSTPFGADEHFDDFERLFAVVGLRDEQVVEIDAELLRVGRVERVLGVDERRHAAELLRFGDHLQRQRRLARRLRPEDLDDAAARHAADAERVVDADGAGGNGVDRLDRALLPEAHDRALAELLLDLADGQFDGFELFAVLTIVAVDRSTLLDLLRAFSMLFRQRAACRCSFVKTPVRKRGYSRFVPRRKSSANLCIDEQETLYNNSYLQTSALSPLSRDAVQNLR